MGWRQTKNCINPWGNLVSWCKRLGSIGFFQSLHGSSQKAGRQLKEPFAYISEGAAEVFLGSVTAALTREDEIKEPFACVLPFKEESVCFSPFFLDWNTAPVQILLLSWGVQPAAEWSWQGFHCLLVRVAPIFTPCSRNSSTAQAPLH